MAHKEDKHVHPVYSKATDERNKLQTLETDFCQGENSHEGAWKSEWGCLCDISDRVGRGKLRQALEEMWEHAQRAEAAGTPLCLWWGKQGQQRGLAGHRNKFAFYSALAHEGTDSSGARKGPDSTHVLLARFDVYGEGGEGTEEAGRPGAASLFQERGKGG